jgi:hypothetical protein
VTFRFTRALGETRKMALGPASAHNGQARAEVWRGTMPLIRQGQGTVTSSSELNPAPPEAEKRRR